MTASKILLTATFIAVSSLLSGQTDTVRIDSLRSRITYFNKLVAGGLVGKKDNGVSASIAMIHGVRYRKFSLGAGISFDDYGAWRTIPLYGSLSLDFISGKKGKLSIQLDAGGTKLYHVESPNEWKTIDEKGGRIVQPALGYRFKAENWSIYFLAGYRFQRIRYLETPPWWAREWGTYYKNDVTRDMERLVVQFGFGLH